MGPATSTADKVRELVEGGMDVARLNFSHGSHADHKQIYDIVRAASDESGRAVGILADLQGPKIRLGTFAAGPVEWSTGDTVRITVEDIEGTHDRVATTYKGLARDARVGDRMLVDDGKIALRVKEVQGSDVVAEVTEGGTVSRGARRRDRCCWSIRGLTPSSPRRSSGRRGEVVRSGCCGCGLVVGR